MVGFPEPSQSGAIGFNKQRNSELGMLCWFEGSICWPPPLQCLSTSGTKGHWSTSDSCKTSEEGSPNEEAIFFISRFVVSWCLQGAPVIPSVTRKMTAVPAVPTQRFLMSLLKLSGRRPTLIVCMRSCGTMILDRYSLQEKGERLYPRPLGARFILVVTHFAALVSASPSLYFCLPGSVQVVLNLQ